MNDIVLNDGTVIRDRKQAIAYIEERGLDRWDISKLHELLRATEGERQ